MRKNKLDKGITLIALIITIIILLILAVVTIGAMQNSNIITYAQNASRDYESGKNKEQGILSEYETILAEESGIGQWKLQEDKETIKNEKTGKIKKIGDTFSNDEVLAAIGGTKSTYEGTWSILGVENGKLKLVSTENVARTNLSIGDKFVPDDLEEIFDKDGAETSFGEEKAIWSWQNAVNTLNKDAQKATGIESARSITIEDLDSEDVLNITKDKKIELYANYGKTFKYFYNTNASKVASRNKALGSEQWSGITTSSLNSQVFVNADGEIVLVNSENENEVTLECTYYNSYTFTENQKEKYGDFLLNTNYWLASPFVLCKSDEASFYVQMIESRYFRVGSAIIFSSAGDTNNIISGCRAIVFI